MLDMFSVKLLPKPIRDISLIREIISNIDTVTELQELTIKYRNTEKLAARVTAQSKRLDRRTIARKYTFLLKRIAVLGNFISSTSLI